MDPNMGRKRESAVHPLLIHIYTTDIHKALGIVHLHFLPNLGFERL